MMQPARGLQETRPLQQQGNFKSLKQGWTWQKQLKLSLWNILELIHME